MEDLTDTGSTLGSLHSQVFWEKPADLRGATPSAGQFFDRPNSFVDTLGDLNTNLSNCKHSLIFNVALTEVDIKRIMNDGLARPLGVESIEPKDKLTAIWVEIKFQH